jgi:hypothetical protein
MLQLQQVALQQIMEVLEREKNLQDTVQAQRDLLSKLRGDIKDEIGQQINRLDGYINYHFSEVSKKLVDRI